MTVDEVVASNVRRLRESKGWSVSDLARELGVGRHIVYDFERPRTGASQRQFLWIDLVNLCYALEATLFDLVLPGDDVELDLDGPFQAKASLARRSGLVVEARSWRSWLGETLFGIEDKDLTPALVERLRGWRRDEEQRRREITLEILKQLEAEG